MGIEHIAGHELVRILPSIPGIGLELIDASHHLVAPGERSQTVGALSLVGFDNSEGEQAIEALRAGLNLKLSHARHQDQKLDTSSVFIVRADIQEARMLVPRLVHQDLARIMCRNAAEPTPESPRLSAREKAEILAMAPWPRRRRTLREAR